MRPFLPTEAHDGRAVQINDRAVLASDVSQPELGDEGDEPLDPSVGQPGESRRKDLSDWPAWEAKELRPHPHEAIRGETADGPLPANPQGS